MGTPRVLIIGLDSIPPRIAFDLFADVMPCLSALRRRGVSGPLRSTVPPVTLPAWITMTTGRDPGELGIYGFRRPVEGSYRMGIVSTDDLDHPRIWDLASAKNLSSVVVSVPLTFPLAADPRVTMTSCFLTPGSHSDWITPAHRRDELEEKFGEYLVDVIDFRSAEKKQLLNHCRALTEQHFAIFRHLIRTSACDLAMVVDLAPDRLHHGLLASILPEHPLHDPESPLVEACRTYYRELDDQIARTMALAGPETTTMIVSDHGVQPLRGGFCVNEWLIDEGYLVLDSRPEGPTPLGRCAVDWSRTRAWGEGGHHCRIFFNVAGRQARGIVPVDRLPAERQRLVQRIEQMTDERGRPMANRVLLTQQCYRAVKGAPPDLIVYWDALELRAIGTVGHRSWSTTTNDTGHDEANHAEDGIVVVAGPGVVPATGAFTIEDVFATVLDALEIEPPEGTHGRSLIL